MKVGDLVSFRGSVGVITCIDPEKLGDTQEVEVFLERWRCWQYVLRYAGGDK